MTFLLRVSLVFSLAGCQRPAPSPPPPVAPASPADTLDSMDSRKPVPLLPMMANHQKQNMRDHLVAVQQIVAGLGADDFAAIEQASKRIGFSEQMGQMCQHMGAGAPGFTEQALQFHKTADGITTAAQAKDKAAVVQALDATLKTCTGCHDTWKQRIVNEAGWTQATASAPPIVH